MDLHLPNNMLKFFLQPGEEEKGLLGKLLDKLRGLFRKKQAVAVKEENDKKDVKKDEGDGEEEEEVKDSEMKEGPGKEEESKKDK